MKYNFTYLDPRGKWYLKSKHYYSFGTSLHTVLQRFHDASDSGVTTVHEAVAALEESWISAGYDSQEEMMQAMDEGKEIVQNYIEAIQREPVTSKTIYVEKNLRLDLGEFVLIGRVDRVDEHEDGSLEIIDYKSGRGSVSTEEVATDLAMGVYQVLLRALHPDRKVRATIVAVRTNVRASAELGAGELESFVVDLKSLGGEMLHRDYQGLLPTPKKICHDCDFLPLCRKSPDFELAADH